MTRIRYYWLEVGVVLMGSATAAIAEPDFEYALRLTGNDAAGFSVRCKSGTGDAAREIEFAGEPPTTQHFHARSLTCEILQTERGGRLIIELLGRNGNVSRVSTSDAGSVVIVSVQ